MEANPKYLYKLTDNQTKQIGKIIESGQIINLPFIKEFSKEIIIRRIQKAMR